MKGNLVPAALLLVALSGSLAFAGPEALDCSPGTAGDATKCGPDDNAPAQFSPAPAVPAGGTANVLSAAARPKVVFQINQAADAAAILGFVTNYLRAEPTAEVAVVGYAGGVDFMLKGAKDAAGKPYADQLRILAGQGVQFKACNNTLKSRKLSADAVVPQATVVPGAVNEIIRLQTREGYAYFRH
jgi:intracellular sulfur oxidation DsrE/DsrF family protein